MSAIDKNLTEQGIPIPDRVMRAAPLFVEYAVEEVKGDTKENYLSRPWFRAIHNPIQKWYEAKYGVALRRPPKLFSGVIEIHGVPFQLEVPAQLRRLSGEKGVAWLVFPIDVEPEENPEDWVANPPNFERMSSNERTVVSQGIGKVARSLRMVDCDLQTALKPDDISEELAKNCFSHLMASAEYLASGPHQSLGLSCWEAHQGVEQVFKLMDRQQRSDHLQIHELKNLFANVEGVAVGVEKSFIKVIPSSSRIIKIRAGEGDGVNLHEAYRIYQAALGAIRECCNALNHKMRMRNAAFKLKQAPWL